LELHKLLYIIINISKIY